MTYQSELLPCPFCGATPHRGLGKKKHDQLHGEPYQDTIIKCPHLCAKMEGGKQSVIERWNTRPAPAVTVTDDMVEAATLALLDHEVRGDLAPGVDWKVERSWTINVVREQMRKALNHALST